MATRQAQQAVAAKIRARYGRFFTKEDYSTFAACSSLTELQSTLLENPDFADVLAQSGEAPHRFTMEQLLRAQFYHDLESLFRFDRFLGSDFYTIMTGLLTVELLLSFARHYNAGTLSDFRPAVSDFFRQHLEFDIHALQRVKTIPALLSVFASHPFSAPLADNIPRGEEPIHLANLEYALLNTYYGQMNRLFDSDKQAYKQARHIFGMMIDIENLQKMIRVRRQHQETETPIRFFSFGNYSDKQLKRLYALPFDHLLAAIQNSTYGAYLLGDQPPDFALKRALHAQCSKQIRRLQQVPALFLCYIILSRSRLDCLTTITEGIRYKMAPDTILSLLPI